MDVTEAKAKALFVSTGESALSIFSRLRACLTGRAKVRLGCNTATILYMLCLVPLAERCSESAFPSVCIIDITLTAIYIDYQTI